jgi:hypothetical protein
VGDLTQFVDRAGRLGDGVVELRAEPDASAARAASHWVSSSSSASRPPRWSASALRACPARASPRSRRMTAVE